MLKHADVYQQISSQIGLKEDAKYKELYDSKDPRGESLHYLALRNFKRFIAILCYLLKNKYQFDVVIGGGNSGIGLAKITELIYQQLNLEQPIFISLPTIRWDPAWHHYHGQKAELFDNSIFIPRVKSQLNNLKTLKKYFICR